MGDDHTPAGGATPRRAPRRAPRPEERGRAAEQTRERILQAAVTEFGAHGYAGARTAGIAARAGVNQQLISYYFGGKQGLLEALRQRWAETEASISPDSASFAAAVSYYLDSTLDQPDWARLVVWQALGDGPGDLAELVAGQRARLGPALDRLRRRQRAGEITTTVTAEFVLLLAHVVAFAPVAMPHIVEAIFGLDPLSAEYRRRCLDQLLTLLAADPEPDPSRGSEQRSPA